LGFFNTADTRTRTSVEAYGMGERYPMAECSLSLLVVFLPSNAVNAFLKTRFPRITAQPAFRILKVPRVGSPSFHMLHPLSF